MMSKKYATLPSEQSLENSYMEEERLYRRLTAIEDSGTYEDQWKKKGGSDDSNSPLGIFFKFVGGLVELLLNL